MALEKNLRLLIHHNKNDVSERKNRTILNMVKSLLGQGQVPKKFWLEAVNCNVHILNRSPTCFV